MSEKQAAKKWTTVREAAEVVGRSYQTVLGWTKQGLLKYKTRDGVRRVRLAAVQELIAVRAESAESKSPKSKPTASKPAKSKPAEPKPAESKPAESKSAKKPTDGTMSRKEFAARAGCSERWASELLSTGVISGYSEKALEAVKVERGLDEANEAAMASSRRRRQAAEADIFEIKRDAMRGKYYEKARVEAVIARLAAGCRAELMALTRSVPVTLAYKLDLDAEAQAAIRSVLLEASREAIERLAGIGEAVRETE